MHVCTCTYVYINTLTLGIHVCTGTYVYINTLTLYIGMSTSVPSLEITWEVELVILAGQLHAKKTKIFTCDGCMLVSVDICVC